MQDTLKIALLQSDLAWHQPEQNRINFSQKINDLEQEVDLVLLPEMFTTGFTMSPEAVAETMEGNSITWMQEMAQRTNTAIGGSLVIQDQGKYYNRFVFATVEGSLETYDKRHTFTLAGEDKVYTAGEEKHIIKYKGWRLCPMVCYDLRFPVWSRNTEDYDVLFYVANWPKPRIEAWDALLKARAIENMAYCIGVNRVGLDHNNHEYSGHSAAFDGLGKQIVSFNDGEEASAIVELEKSHLIQIREKLKFLQDRDRFNLIM